MPWRSPRAAKVLLAGARKSTKILSVPECLAKKTRATASPHFSVDHTRCRRVGRRRPLPSGRGLSPQHSQGGRARQHCPVFGQCARDGCPDFGQPSERVAQNLGNPRDEELPPAALNAIAEESPDLPGGHYIPGTRAPMRAQAPKRSRQIARMQKSSLSNGGSRSSTSPRTAAGDAPRARPGNRDLELSASASDAFRRRVFSACLSLWGTINGKREVKIETLLL